MTGGALKGSKCFFHLITFGFNADGTWYYDKNEDEENFQIGIPTRGNDAKLIEHCGVDRGYIRGYGRMFRISGSS